MIRLPGHAGEPAGALILDGEVPGNPQCLEAELIAFRHADNGQLEVVRFAGTEVGPAGVASQPVVVGPDEDERISAELADEAPRIRVEVGRVRLDRALAGVTSEVY